MGYLIPKLSLLKNRSDATLLIAGTTKGYIFSEGISPKVSVIVRLEFELAYFATILEEPRLFFLHAVK